MFADSIALAAVCILVASLVRWYNRRRSGSVFPGPPGPLGFPLVGNLFDIPSPANAYRQYHEMSRHYSEYRSFSQTFTPYLHKDMWQTHHLCA